MIVVVGRMIVPLAERSTMGCGAGDCRLAALAGITIVTRSVAGAASTAVLLGLVTEAAAKMCQASVAYQGSPKDDQ
jgi:hypothetical protein